MKQNIKYFDEIILLEVTSDNFKDFNCCDFAVQCRIFVRDLFDELREEFMGKFCDNVVLFCNVGYSNYLDEYWMMVWMDGYSRSKRNIKTQKELFEAINNTVNKYLRESSYKIGRSHD